MVAPVVNMPSSKHSGVSGRDTQLFCQHSAESPLRGGYAQSLTKWAQTPLNQGGPEASWPSFVDPIARVRMVAWPNSAWTQGLANQIAVGLECAGYARFSKAEWLTPEGMKQLENLAHEWVYYWKLEKDAGNEIPLRWLTTPEVQKVMAGNRSIKGFCTHAQIDPNSRTDPGPNFPYAQLLKRIGEIIGGKVTTAAASKPTTDPLEEIMAMYEDRAAFEKRMAELIVANGPGYNPSGDKNDLTHHIKYPGQSILNTRMLGNDGKEYRVASFIRADNTRIIEALRNTRTILAQNEALTAAVAALAGSKGIDVGPIISAIEGAADRAVAKLEEKVDQTMDDLEVNLTVNKGEQ